ncbi:MAG: hypothetical protein DRN66_03370 [Candidatus Nanohalarchaeota archaeon]|nr:MAG: hypothetical protein DRN66_03370 [Candidatus Nanohaloarchaeota archaeon]
MDLKFLEEFGLTNKEACVYVALLGKNTKTISQIMEKTKITRRGCHNIIKKLINLGIVNYVTKNDEKQYCAINPKALINILEEKKKNLESIMPELSWRYKHKKEEENIIINIYDDKQGIKNILRHQLTIKKTLYVYSNKAEIFDFLKYYMPQHLMKRRKEKIKGKIILNEEIKGKSPDYPEEDKVKYLPKTFCSPLIFVVYGDYVHLIILSKPMIIFIKSKEISESYKKYFNFMWKMAKE